jgi:hypothetical protein
VGDGRFRPDDASARGSSRRVARIAALACGSLFIVTI